MQLHRGIFHVALSGSAAEPCLATVTGPSAGEPSLADLLAQSAPLLPSRSVQTDLRGDRPVPKASRPDAAGLPARSDGIASGRVHACGATWQHSSRRTRGSIKKQYVTSVGIGLPGQQLLATDRGCPIAAYEPDSRSSINLSGMRSIFSGVSYVPSAMALRMAITLSSRVSKPDLIIVPWTQKTSVHSAGWRQFCPSDLPVDSAS